MSDLIQPLEVDYEALPESASVMAHLGAGAIAGIMEHTLMFPIDSIKTRAQIAANLRQPSGMLEAFSRISATEGALVLWRGVSSVILGAGPAHALYFSVFEATKTFLCNHFVNAEHNANIITDENHPFIAAASGMAGTTAADALMTPFDVMKQRMQISAGHGSVSVLARHMFRTEGFRSFYISYPTTLLMNIPFAALNFGFYEYSSELLNPENKYNPMVHCVAGGVSGAIAAAITNPIDCVKTVLQTKGASTDANIRTNVKGFSSAAKVIIDQAGYRGFLRGMAPRVVFNIPATAISWTAYEMAKAYLIRGNTKLE
ncbi:hypothetical protein BABINDRAFT_162258 [Babjeviella inositovora NRRL Y-12698]|uniref:Uncharacterized protein n=1 Tax=Babjeviella inositovora NRRL Y-12698 TaxID=984486 RepID=A0A1E3QND6_9ASCO|nr:uncharacterized protein BABINDRAFT_162258 [Babjeviella inositovora NRRL Y-12698]ODQ79219.1 hypothetical protein BABINDRAFT_162258 [Babjeviella inositovora NRRL Y-12698]